MSSQISEEEIFNVANEILTEIIKPGLQRAVRAYLKVMGSIREYVEHSKSTIVNVEKKLESIPAYCSNDYVLALDPTGSSLVYISKYETEEGYTVLTMLPLLRPYMDLIVSLAIERGLVPAYIIKTIPVMYGLALLTEDTDDAIAAAIMHNIILLPRVIEGAMSIMLPETSMLSLPVRSEYLYYTSRGITTRKIEDRAIPFRPKPAKINVPLGTNLLYCADKLIGVKHG